MVGLVRVALARLPQFDEKSIALSVLYFLGTTPSLRGNTCLVCWHLLKDWRQGKPECATDRVDARAWRGPQQRAAAILFDLDGAQIEQIVNDALPFRHGAAAAGQSLEQLLA